MQIRSSSTAGGSLVCRSTLKARSMQPQACLDLLYLDCGPHPAQSLQSVCPGMPPLTAILPWNKGELFGKGWQNQHAVCRLSPRHSGPFGPAVCSMHQRPVSNCRMLGLIKHLAVCVFRVRSRRLKEITYGEKQWGDVSHFGATAFQLCAGGGMRTSGPLQSSEEAVPDHLVITCSSHHT